MIIALQILGGLLLLFFGGEGLVIGAVALARHIGVSMLVIGLTIVALGTSAPEFVVSMIAMFDGHPDIAVGNVIGSNIANILLVLGLSALIFPINIHPGIAKRDSPTLAVITCLLVIFCMTGPAIAMWEGIALISCLVGYMIYTVVSSRDKRKARHEAEEIEEELAPKMKVWPAILLTLLGAAALAYGAELFVTGSVELARLMGLSEAVISVTLVAIGTSAPEIATSVVAATRKHADIAVGNVVGSNLLNIMGVLGPAALVAPLPISAEFLDVDIWLMLGVTILLAAKIRISEKIHRTSGGLFFGLYLVYITALLLTG